MASTDKPKITVTTIVNAPIEKVWKAWTTPDDITQWNYASEEWHSPRAENDLRNGGQFNYRMEARDGSVGFDFEGVYDAVNENESIRYTMGDRKVDIRFIPIGQQTQVEETFEAEDANPLELQRNGWQAILDNFKKHAEGQ